MAPDTTRKAVNLAAADARRAIEALQEQSISLQRELAEARAEIDQWRAAVRDYVHGDAVVFCPPPSLHEAAMRSVPGPSDAKGEEPVPKKWALARRLCEAVGIECASAAGPATAIQHAMAAIESLKSSASLTPLTDPSVRGVLVPCADDDPHLSIVVDDVTGRKCVGKLRPASEFGVPDTFAILDATKAEAERLRKAIEEALKMLDDKTNLWQTTVVEGIAILQAALTPPTAAASTNCNQQSSDCNNQANLGIKHPTAASGKFGVCMICGADLERADQCLACDKCETPKQAEPNRAVNPPRTSCQSDAAESVGDAPLISPTAPAAESEVGDELAPLRRAVQREKNWVASYERVSARLAACEERCRELEAGIEKHQRQHQAIYEELDGAEKFDRELWSLLAPKAEGAKVQ